MLQRILIVKAYEEIQQNKKENKEKVRKYWTHPLLQKRITEKEGRSLADRFLPLFSSVIVELSHLSYNKAHCLCFSLATILLLT